MLAIAGALASALLAPRAHAAQEVAGPTSVHAIIVGPAASGDGLELGARLLGLLRTVPFADADIGRADRFDERDLFRLDRADADRPTAWVVIGGAVARVRVAGAGRQQYIFRDVAVSQPLTELDRERVSQLVKSMLATLIDSGPGVLARSDAEAAAGVAAGAPDGALMVDGKSRRADGVGVGPEPPVRPVLGAIYQAQYTELGVSHGPGIVIGVEWTRPRVRPAAWLMLAYALPSQITSTRVSGSEISLWAGGPVLRAGASLALARWFRLDLGAGLNLVHLWGEGDPGYFLDSLGQPPTVWVGRAALRMGPASVGGWRVSLSAVFEGAKGSSGSTVSSTPIGSSAAPVAYSNPRTGFFFHPGLALEVWSH